MVLLLSGSTLSIYLNNIAVVGEEEYNVCIITISQTRLAEILGLLTITITTST
jgi:hypothetical protein